MAQMNGTVFKHYTYDAYGTVQTGNAQVTASSSTAEVAAADDTSRITSKLYCGEQYDKNLQMYNLRSRYYDPVNDRFNQRDKFSGNNDDPQSLHKYLYCGCDSVNGIDPSGMATLIELGVAMSTVGLVSGLIAGTVSRVLFGPGNFWSGFIKGFISGALTIGLVMVGLPPQWASAIGSGSAQAIIELWNWWQHPETFTKWQAGIRVVVGYLGGYWFAKNLSDNSRSVSASFRPNRRLKF